jgi:hypothetical protein
VGTARPCAHARRRGLWCTLTGHIEQVPIETPMNFKEPIARLALTAFSSR